MVAWKRLVTGLQMCNHKLPPYANGTVVTCCHDLYDVVVPVTLCLRVRLNCNV